MGRRTHGFQRPKSQSFSCQTGLFLSYTHFFMLTISQMTTHKFRAIVNVCLWIIGWWKFWNKANHMQILYLNAEKVFTWNFKIIYQSSWTMFIAWWISEGIHASKALIWGDGIKLGYCIWFCEYHDISFHSWFIKWIKHLRDNFSFHLKNNEWKI